MAKKIHWTQTPAGKKKASEAQKNRYRKAKKTSTEVPVSGGQEEAIERQIAYAFGHTQAWIEHYANTCGIPARTIAYRLGGLLQRASRR